MVVTPGEGGASAGAGARDRWGTWEELLLGGAVVRHGTAAWAVVADELRTRTPFDFSPEDCKAKFAEIQSRYSPSNSWYEELRKQRIAELKRNLEKSEKSIGHLQSVIERLNNCKNGDGNSDCHAIHTESCSNIADTKSSSKELPRHKSSVANFIEEAGNCQKTQQVQINNTSTEKPFLKTMDEKVPANDNLFWGSRKQRGNRVGRIIQKAGTSDRDYEPPSTSCIEMEGSSEGCKEDMKKGLNLKAPNVESGTAKEGLKTSNIESVAMKKDLKTADVEPGVMKKGPESEFESGVLKNGLETPKLESGVMKNDLKTPEQESVLMKDSLKTPEVESGVSEIEREEADLASIVKYISTQGDCLMLQRQVDIQRKRATYKKMIRQHMDFRIIHSKIKSGAISSIKELLRDILLFVSNVMVFYPKGTLEHMAAAELRGLAVKILNQGASFIFKTAGAPLAKKNAQASDPGRHGPGDADAIVSARQGEGKDSRSDKPPAAQKSEPAKKRGVGRPPKSGPLNRSAQAPEDSPSRGRKRNRRGA